MLSSHSQAELSEGILGEAMRHERHGQLAQIFRVIRSKQQLVAVHLVHTVRVSR